MSLKLNPAFAEYLDHLHNIGQISAKSRINYGQYVKWIEQFGSGIVDVPRLSDDAKVIELIAEIADGYEAHPTPQRKNP